MSTSETRYQRLPHECEALLKLGFLLAIFCLGNAPASADRSTDLVVGSIRDQRGAPLVGAQVDALDAKGLSAGSVRTDALGTFAVPLTRPTSSLEVRCRHCRTTRIVLGRSTNNIALVIVRYEALDSDVPSPRDLVALPYGAPVDALGLIPFTLVSRSSISDRGLGGGNALIFDDGAPLADDGRGSSALQDFPDRYARSLQTKAPEHAYQYGINAGGGIFAVDQLDVGQTAGSSDAGGTPSLALTPAIRNFYPAAGVSSDGGIVARRADIDYAAPFEGGELRVGYGTGAEDGDGSRNFSTTRFDYATTSRNYRTFADLAASDVAFSDGPAMLDYRSGYVNADFRIERPGVVTLSAGANDNQQSSVYAYDRSDAYSVANRTTARTAFVQAQAGDERASVDAGFGLTDVTSSERLETSLSADHIAILPSISTRASLGGGTYARAGYSESAQVPTAESAPSPTPSVATPPYERSELEESAIGFDDGARLRAEAIIYREFTAGSDRRRIDGIGVSFVWQIAPLVSIRAWSLRVSPLDVATPFENESDASRQVLWSTYANGDGLRLDAIVHREATLAARGAPKFDGDALVPVLPHVAVDVGSAQRAGARRYSIGLRLQP